MRARSTTLFPRVRVTSTSFSFYYTMRYDFAAISNLNGGGGEGGRALESLRFLLWEFFLEELPPPECEYGLIRHG